MPNEMTEKDKRNFPARPKRKPSGDIPVRVGFFGAPESQNQRARVAYGDSGVKKIVKADEERGRKSEEEYQARKKRKKAASLKDAVDQGVEEGS